MKRTVQLVLVCTIMLALASMVSAQSTPTPVTRIGDWVEIGNEAFMNIIGRADIRYTTSHNLDFEDEIRDRAGARHPADTNHDQEMDAMRAEIRWGADFRYQKNLRLRILFEYQQTFDGNLIDDRTDNNLPGPETDVFGRTQDPNHEGEPTNLERFWIDYKWPGTPLRMRVGSDLWRTDQAGIIGDDDPRFAVFADFGQWDLYGAAVIQFESSRIGLINDNDLIYYTFGAGYDMKPHRFQLDIVYFRDRFQSTCAAGTGSGGVACDRLTRHADTVVISPSWSGKIGPLTGLLQFMVVTGEVENTAGEDFDVFAWSGIAYLEADLGMVAPFAGIIYGSGDDDPTDNDMEGFHPTPYGEITLFTATRFFRHLNPSLAGGQRDTACPARANIGGGSQQCSHSVGNPYNGRVANTEHGRGTNTEYSNPGTIFIPVGLKIFPAKGHQIIPFYIYRGFVHSDLVESRLGVADIGKSQFHNLAVHWIWRINKHLDFRLTGQMAFAGDGYKDIAETQTCDGGVPCEGDDVALWAAARIRARF